MFKVGDLVKYKNGQRHYKISGIGNKGCLISILNPIAARPGQVYYAEKSELEFVNKKKKEASPIKWV